MPWLRGLGVVSAVVVAATALANPVLADPGLTPGVKVEDENSACTAGFAAQGNDGSHYLMTSGHCDAHDGAPRGDVGGRYFVRDVLSATQIRVGMPFCKVGAVTGETCGVVKDVADDVVEASVFSLDGDSGSPGFVKNPDGTVSAVGLLMSSPEGDDNTTYFALVNPLLDRWGLRILP